MREVDGVVPPDAHDGGREQEEPGNETVRNVILQLLERCATDIAKAERQEAAEKLAARPLVAAALGRKLMTGQKLAKLLPTSEASISAMKRDVRPSRHDDLALEAAIRDVAVRWRAAIDAGELAEALRWRWITIGDWVGVSDRSMASAARIKHSRVNEVLNRTSPEKATEYRRRIVKGIGQAAPTPGTDLEDIVPRLMMQHAVDMSPEDPDVSMAAGWYFKKLGLFDIAGKYYERAVVGGSPCAAHNLALVHEANGDVEQAERWFVEADVRGHRCANTTRHGSFLMAQGRGDDARTVWAAAADRGVAAAARYMAEHLHQEGQHEVEALWWERAAVLGDTGGLRSRGWRLWHQGRQEAAERAYLEAATRGDAASACWMGRQMMSRGAREAQTLLEQASNAGHTEATEALISLLHTRDPRRALSACRQLARQGGTPPRVHYALLLEEEDGTQEALNEAYELWLEQIDANLRDDRGEAGEEVELIGDIAVAYWKAGHLARSCHSEAEAEELLWKALKTDDTGVISAAMMELAELDCEPGQTDDAHRLQALRRVADEALSLGYYQVALPTADILEAGGASEDAVEMLRVARRRAKRHSVVAADLEAEQLYQALPDDYVSSESLIYEETIRRWMRCARDGSRRAYMFLGTDYMTNMTEQPRDALACFRWLVDHEEPYHRELGEAMLLCEDPHVEEALDEGIADGEVDCYGLRGMVEARGGRLREALDIWAEGASAGDWESGVYAGQALQRAGRIDEARAMLKRTAERGSSCAWSALGTLEYEERGRGHSLKHFRRAMNDGCRHGAYNLAVALLASQAPTAASRAEARSALRIVLRATPGDLAAARLLASLSAQEGAPELAEVLYDSALTDPGASELVAALDAKHHPDRRIRRGERGWRLWRRRSHAKPGDADSA